MADRGSLNKVILIGRLTKNPDIKKVIKRDTHLARFTLATNEYYKRGEKEHVEYHYIVAWGALAQFVGNYLKQGSLVNIIGKMRYRYYQDESGEKRRIAEVQANEIICLGRKEDYEEVAEEPEAEDEEKVKEEDPF